MGKYVNRGNSDFAEARGERYVDKSGLVAFVNKALLTQERMICVSRARRFGKSLALQMLYAYYDCSCDSHSLFDDLAITQVRERNYPQLVQEFADRLLLVGINYDKKTKKHECRIEKWGENASEGLSKGLSKGLSWKQVAENLEINPDKVGLLVPLMRQPVLLKDLRIACGFTNSTKFKKRYIDPLLSLDLIAMTQPDKLTSPTQKYYLTEKGKNISE